MTSVHRCRDESRSRKTSYDSLHGTKGSLKVSLAYVAIINFKEIDY